MPIKLNDIKAPAWFKSCLDHHKHFDFLSPAIATEAPLLASMASMALLGLSTLTCKNATALTVTKPVGENFGIELVFYPAPSEFI